MSETSLLSIAYLVIGILFGVGATILVHHVREQRRKWADIDARQEWLLPRYELWLTKQFVPNDPNWDRVYTHVVESTGGTLENLTVKFVGDANHYPVEMIEEFLVGGSYSPEHLEVKHEHI